MPLRAKPVRNSFGCRRGGRLRARPTEVNRALNGVPVHCGSCRTLPVEPPCTSAGSGKRTRTSLPSTVSRSRFRRGECFGLLGPNGAGKTTTIEICEGLTAAGRRRCRGARPPLGFERPALRQRLGIQLQETQLSDKLTVLETLTLFRSFYASGAASVRPDRAGSAAGKA